MMNQYRITNVHQALMTNLARLAACLLSSLSFSREEALTSSVKGLSFSSQEQPTLSLEL